MADENAPKKDENRKKLYRSAQGPVVAGSVRETDKYLEAQIQEGPNFSVKVRAYDDQVREKLKEAIDSGDEFLVRGVLFGSKSKDNVHIAVNSINNPMIAKGRVVRISHSAPDKQPFVSGFIIQEIEPKSGNGFKIGKPFRAFGDSAVALASLEDNQFINGEAREVVIRRKKDDEVVFLEAIEYVGAVSIEGPAVRQDVHDNDTPDAEVEQALDEAAYDESVPSFDDDVPF